MTTFGTTELDETIATLFIELHGLAGFSVTDATSMIGSREAGQLIGDLSLADITVIAGFSARHQDYFGDIAVALVDLLEEHPEAREMLRNHTFARTLN